VNPGPRKQVRLRPQHATLKSSLGVSVIWTVGVIGMLVALASPAEAADSDADGIPDGLETLVGTDPLDPDTDGDTVPDGAELLDYGTNPLSDDAVCHVWETEELSTYVSLSWHVAVADFDGDGLDDVAAARSGDFAWYANLGGMAFDVRVVLHTSSSWDHEVHPADIDGDGDPDLVMKSRDGVTVVENLGAGAWGAAVPLTSLGAEVRTSAVFDLDGDADLDVITATDLGVAWYENLGTTFAPEALLVAGAVVDLLAPADIDSDGDADLFAGHEVVAYTEWDLQAFENLGGTLAGPVVVQAATAHMEDLTAADLDGDGDPEPAWINGVWGGGTVFWRENLGGGAFGPVENRQQSREPTAITTGDLDQDGDLDLVVGVNNRGVGWLENLGNGFAPYATLTWEISLTQDVAVGDLDGDGQLDDVAHVGGVNNGNVVGIDVAVSRNIDQLDLDVDGLLSGVEVCVTGTDPQVADTDGDLDADGTEVWAHTDPLSVHDGVDTDGDGLDDDLEALAGSNPLDPDTDGDTVPDGFEVWVLGTDPTVTDPDTDGDGIADPVEVLWGTDPAAADSDGDRLSDLQEWVANTDPLDPDTDGDTWPDSAEQALGLDPLVAGLPAQSPWAPRTLALSAPAPLPGHPLDATISGAPAGSQVALLSTAAGDAPCTGAPADSCLVQPQIVGWGVADGAGVAMVSADVPLTAWIGTAVSLQAISVDGPIQSSGVLALVVQPTSCTDDVREPNNTPATAMDIDPWLTGGFFCTISSTLGSLDGCPGDRDLYEFSGNLSSLGVELHAADGDTFLMEVYDPSGAVIESTTWGELWVNSPNWQSRYTLVVSLHRDVGVLDHAPYSLEFSGATCEF